MSEVVYSSEDLTVYGGPTSLRVDVDFGPAGIRGSRIYGVLGDPRTLPTAQLPVDLIATDLAVNVNPSDPNYLTVYQKVGFLPQEWIDLYSIVPNVFSTKQTLTFANGLTTASIPLSTIFTVPDYSLARFTVQYVIEGGTDNDGNPIIVSSGMNLSVRAAQDQQYLDLKLNAVEFNGTSWTKINGARVVHLFATVV
jgi:hypothetical protein